MSNHRYASEAPRSRAGGRVIALGASTGGTVALERLLACFPEHGPPVLITQHIPGSFSKALAKTLSRAGPLEVVEARDGQPVQTGFAYLAPGGQHLELDKLEGAYFCKVSDSPPVGGHRPSVDVLFHSVARNAGALAIAMLLTGMGRDGAEGLAAIRRNGGHTFAQDKSSSVVWGMPKAAIELGAAVHVRSLGELESFFATEL